MIVSKIQDLMALKLEIGASLTELQEQELSSLLNDCKQSLTIAVSSCKLLNFNVEDILALPRLKMGKFTKNIKTFDISDSFNEVI